MRRWAICTVRALDRSGSTTYSARALRRRWIVVCTTAGATTHTASTPTTSPSPATVPPRLACQAASHRNQLFTSDNSVLFSSSRLLSQSETSLRKGWAMATFTVMGSPHKHFCCDSYQLQIAGKSTGNGKFGPHGPADTTAILKPPSSLASFKSRLVLPFWYWLAQVVLEKRPLN